MADSIRTDTALLAALPSSKLKGRGAAVSSEGPLGYQDVRDLFVKTRQENICNATRMVDAGLVASDPTTPNTIAIYRVNLTAGTAMVSGLAAYFAAGDDQVFLGAGAVLDAYKLDGTAGAVLTADGKTYWAAFVNYSADGSLGQCVILGAEADDASEAQVTSAQILAALKAAGLTNLDSTVFNVFARIKIQRVAVDTITMTHTAVTDGGLATERARGTAGDLVS